MKSLRSIGFCTIVMLCAVATSYAEPWTARHGLTSPQFQKEFNLLTSQGYRMIYISGYAVNDEERFAAIWDKKPGPPWVAKHGMTSAQYQNNFAIYDSMSIGSVGRNILLGSRGLQCYNARSSRKVLFDPLVNPSIRSK